MKKLLWRLRYAWILSRRADLSLTFAWGCAEAAYEANLDFPMTPAEAVHEELLCWTN